MNELNHHNKAENKQMHSAEHILNGTMDRKFNCGRAKVAHIERKKSKCDYVMEKPLTEEQVKEVEAILNDVISKKLPITMEFAKIDDVRNRFAIERLPEDASDIVRIVHIGDYDECLCIGAHVNNTSEIGKFRISSTRFIDGMFRIVFRLDVEE